MTLQRNPHTYSPSHRHVALPQPAQMYRKPGEMLLMPAPDNPAVPASGRTDFSRSSLPAHLHYLLTPRPGFSAGQHFVPEYPYLLDAALSVTARQGAVSLAPYHADSDKCALVIERQTLVKFDLPPLHDLVLSYIGLNPYFTEVRFYNRAGRIVAFRRLNATKKRHEVFWFAGMKPVALVIETSQHSSVLLDEMVWNQTVDADER
ncbi:hypothetical protein ACWXWB_11200 [Pantoea dispersa]|uniref:hypothetical protein n=1 Tax=Pantoea dispersa TaxID=59814 RepID=UPI002DB86621|nr:hypothetical protein [Pantoea dispersa]MEB5972063.1 hypothetical protein [Pantoea dispersa]